MLNKLNPDVTPVRIRNPLSQDLSVLSTTLAYNLLGVVSRNKNRLERNVRIFELGKVFLARRSPLPEERLHLGIAVSGNREPRQWETEEAETDLFDLKGILEGLFDHLLLPFELSPGGNAFLHADKCFYVQMGDEKVGILGEVSEKTQDTFGIKDKVFLVELDFEKLTARVPKRKEFSSLPKFPPVDRDIAMVVEEALLSKMIGDKIKEVGAGMVEEVALFDVYKGKQVPAGKKSLAYSIRYRSQEKTLTDEEVDRIHQKVISELEKSFDATLRE